MKMVFVPTRLLVAIFALVIVGVYLPTLSGPFLLDDFAWLPNLEHASPSPLSRSFWHYALSGTFTGGRVVPMMTFALQSGAWPDNPAAFKAVNIALHLLNFVLLFIVVRHAMVALNAPVSARLRWLAVGTAILWALSPSQVGAVVYVIQRMNLLAALFSLLTLLAYFSARTAYLAGAVRRATWWAAGGAIFLLLGLASKENAATVALVISLTELQLAIPQGRLGRALRRIIIVTPWLVLTAYFAVRFNDFAAAYSLRDFTMADRVLLAPVILWQYVANFFFPTPHMLSLFQDDFPPPHTVWLPLLATAAWIAVLWAAVRARHWTSRLASIGLSWFLAAHAIEASIVPLELYFPHRNYFPSAGLALATVALVYRGFDVGTRTMKRAVIPVTATIICAGMLATTVYETQAWAEKGQLIRQWYTTHRNSDRAMEAYAQVLFDEGHHAASVEVYRRRQAQRPSDVLTVLETATLDCVFGGSKESRQFSDEDWRQMPAGNPVATASLLLALTENHVMEKCQPLAPDALRSLIGNLLDRPAFSSVTHALLESMLLLEIQSGRLDEAAFIADRIFKETGSPIKLRHAAELLAAAQDVESARAYLLRHQVSVPLRPRELLLNATIQDTLRDLARMPEPANP